jgi:protein SCO1/2
MKSIPGSRVVVLLAVLGSSACGTPDASRHYELRGQIIGVDRDRQELLIKHEDIKGYMPGMTMPFKVKDASLMAGRVPGDLITATLEVAPEDAYLSAIRKTGTAAVDTPPPAPSASSGFELLHPGEAVPDQAFVDQDGRPFTISSVRGRALAITFIYTSCPIPTFCPFLDRQFAIVQKAVKRTPALHDRVKLLSVSFDPAHDTPAVLKTHARGLGADANLWSFLTGNRDDIDRFAARFGVTIVREDTEIAHNLRTVIVDPNGALVKVYTGIEWTPQQILEDLERVAAHGDTE